LFVSFVNNFDDTGYQQVKAEDDLSHGDPIGDMVVGRPLEHFDPGDDKDDHKKTDENSGGDFEV
jgi:hypothetical protein